MKKLLGVTVTAVFLVGSLAGCATRPSPVPEPSQQAQLNLSAFSKKADTFVVVLDASSSMSDTYQDRLKLERAKELVSRMNQMIPPLDYRAALLAFASGSCLGCDDAMVLYGVAPYSRAGFDAALAGFRSGGEVSGVNPMGGGIGVNRAILHGAPGQVALIVVSDAENIFHGRAIMTAQKLKGVLGDRLCIYPIQVDRDEDGRKVMNELTKVGGCGFSVNADDIASPNAMAGYIAEVLLAPAPAMVPLSAAPAYAMSDADGDGVPDGHDKCPNTPKGVKANANGCWMPPVVYFDTDKAVIKSTNVLEEAVAILKATPSLSGEVHGHTDSTGSEDHNQKLSEDRARAVRDYFANRGIAPERLRAQGFGETRPVASNDTREGQAMNRRVEMAVGGL